VIRLADPFLSGRKGISPNIAAAFFVLVIAISSNLMLSTAPLLELQSNLISEKNVRDRDKLAEAITFLSVQVGNNKLSITAFNSGAVGTARSGNCGGAHFRWGFKIVSVQALLGGKGKICINMSISIFEHLRCILCRGYGRNFAERLLSALWLERYS